MAQAVAPWDADGSGVSHYYEYLTEGFLAGHTSLSVRPADDLLALADPYKPGQRVSRRLVDASLYHGKYYIYYGPAPAVVLMVPWRLLTGRELPQRVAVALFGALGLAALALLLSSVRRRHFPAASDAVLALAFACAFFASWLPVVIRRPFFWELPIVASVACLWWALFLLWKFHDSGGGTGGGVAAGAALALMIGSRVTCLLAAAAILVLLIPAGAAPAGAGRRVRAFLLATLVVLCAGLGLLAYNYERFGRWLEFGQSYQLWGDEYRNMTYVSPRYVPFNAYLYLFAIASPSPYFPFVRPALPLDGPSGYLGIDEVYGALVGAPVQLAGLFAVAWLVARRRDPVAKPLLVTVFAAAAASLLSAAILLMWGGACSRYESEFWAGWTVVTAMGVLAAFGEPGRRTALRAAIIASGAWTAAFVLLASADYAGIARATRPGEYAVIARMLDYPSLWWARARGIAYGPVDLVIRIPETPATGAVALLESGRRDRLSQLMLVRESPGEARLELVEDGTRVVVATAPFPTPGGTVHARVGAPWLYPPAAHPYWDAIEDSSARRAMQSGFMLQAGSGAPVSAEARSEDAEEFSPRAESRGDPGAEVGWVETLARAGAGAP
jgi:hypothetical protein